MEWTLIDENNSSSWSRTSSKSLITKKGYSISALTTYIKPRLLLCWRLQKGSSSASSSESENMEFGLLLLKSAIYASICQYAQWQNFFTKNIAYGSLKMKLGRLSETPPWNMTKQPDLSVITNNRKICTSRDRDFCRICDPQPAKRLNLPNKYFFFGWSLIHVCLDLASTLIWGEKSWLRLAGFAVLWLICQGSSAMCSYEVRINCPWKPLGFSSIILSFS